MKALDATWKKKKKKYQGPFHTVMYAFIELVFDFEKFYWDKFIA